MSSRVGCWSEVKIDREHFGRVGGVERKEVWGDVGKINVKEWRGREIDMSSIGRNMIAPAATR